MNRCRNTDKHFKCHYTSSGTFLKSDACRAQKCCATIVLLSEMTSIGCNAYYPTQNQQLEDVPELRKKTNNRYVRVMSVSEINQPVTKPNKK